MAIPGSASQDRLTSRMHTPLTLATVTLPFLVLSRNYCIRTRRFILLDLFATIRATSGNSTTTLVLIVRFLAHLRSYKETLTCCRYTIYGYALASIKQSDSWKFPGI